MYTNKRVKNRGPVLQYWCDAFSKSEDYITSFWRGLGGVVKTGLSVRHILHFGIAHSMIDQHQPESRAGRDGKSAMAITYVSANQRQSSNSSSGYGRQELEHWARNVHQCLRIIQSQYLDGVAVTCSLLLACTLCAYCTKQLHQDLPAQPQRLPHAHSSSTIPFQPTPLPPILLSVFTKVTSIPKQPSLEDTLLSMMDGFPDSEPMYSDPIFTQTWVLYNHRPDRFLWWVFKVWLSSTPHLRLFLFLRPVNGLQMNMTIFLTSIMSDNPQSGFTTAKDHYAWTSTWPAPGIMARVDTAAVQQGQNKFQQEVIDPILCAMSCLEHG